MNVRKRRKTGILDPNAQHMGRATRAWGLEVELDWAVGLQGDPGRGHSPQTQAWAANPMSDKPPRLSIRVLLLGLIPSKGLL